jgi:isochorismate pyruvate lyase
MNARAASECTDMSEVRAEIDAIDLALVDLIARRFSYVDRAWQLKKDPREAYVPWRIQQVIDKVRVRASEKGLPPELTEALWRQMIGWFVQYEEEKLRRSLEGNGGSTRRWRARPAQVQKFPPPQQGEGQRIRRLACGRRPTRVKFGNVERSLSMFVCAQRPAGPGPRGGPARAPAFSGAPPMLSEASRSLCR